MSYSYFWNPPVELTPAEERIIKRCRGHRKFYIFLREHRHEFFDEAFQQELEDMYRKTGAGKCPLPPAQLAMLTLLQKYTRASDKEAIELTADSRRWQMVLGCFGEEEPLTSASVLYDFRMRLMATDMDKRILERSVEVARKTGGFSAKTLRLALDSNPLEGHGRVEDTFNMLAHASQKAIACVSKLANLTVKEVKRRANLDLFDGSSLKATLDIDWSDEEAKAKALEQLYYEVEALDLWLVETFPLASQTGELKEARETLDRLLCQDLQPGEEHTVELKEGVAPDRQISVEDEQMRHGRKSKKKRFDGYKRHIGRDLDENLILSVEVTAANVSDANAFETLVGDAQAQGRKLTSLHFDRQYLHAEQVVPLREQGVEILCKSPASSNRHGLWSKREFSIDVEKMKATCPADITIPFELGQVIEFPASSCDMCELRNLCTKRQKGAGRTIQIHENEKMYQELRVVEGTKEGREDLRKRTGVEHALAHVSQRQGNKARYDGARKNLFELRIVCAIQNMERTQAMIAQNKKKVA